MTDIVARLRDYLGNGGFFNPELMDHAKVRDMVMDCRDEIERLRAELALKEAVGNELNNAVANCASANSYIDELEAERDALRALLRECRSGWYLNEELNARIDAALNKGDGDE